MIPSKAIQVDDRLVLFGYGLFETLLITELGPAFTDLHWQRMNNGATRLGLELPSEVDWLRHVKDFLVHTPRTVPYALRVTLSGGAPQSDLPAQLMFHPRSIPYTSAQYAEGIRLHLLPTPRNELSPLTSIKSTNYLENILAKETAAGFGAEEGLWLNSQGYVCEGSMSNLFFIKEETLFTPALTSGCLPGTRRHIILSLACSLQINTEESLFPLSALLTADHIFMTNSLMGIMPVRQISSYSFKPGSENSSGLILKQLQSAYHNILYSH